MRAPFVQHHLFSSNYTSFWTKNQDVGQKTPADLKKRTTRDNKIYNSSIVSTRLETSRLLPRNALRRHYECQAYAETYRVF